MYKSIHLLRIAFDNKVEGITEIPFNQDYESISFNIDGTNYQSRLAKKTPKKKGYFLACWIKNFNNINIPYREDNFSDYLLVLILDVQNKGYFKFPKSVLIEKGILKSPSTKGKMAFRVYPNWENDLNATALKTQAWQVQYFYKLN